MESVSKIIKKITGTHILLIIIGVLMGWQGLQNMTVIDSNQEVMQLAYDAKESYLKSTFAAQNIEDAVLQNKTEVIDSIDALRNEIIVLFRGQKDSIDLVYKGVLLPLVKQVDVNTVEISVLKAKERERVRKEILLTMEGSGIK